MRVIGQVANIGDMLQRDQFGIRIHVGAGMAQDFHQLLREVGMAGEQ